MNVLVSKLEGEDVLGWNDEEPRKGLPGIIDGLTGEQKTRWV
jgi:hypothetical protein